jgi:hypothetical protein
LFLILAAAFAFYWGGMISSYRAPGRKKLHGTLVAPATFAISPLINVLTGEGLFPQIDSLQAISFMLVVLLVATIGAYIGARRGVALYAHNRRFIERRKQQRAEKKQVASEPERRG